MAILKVARLGHPVLRKVAQAIPEKEVGTPEFQRFIDDMIETMREYDGVGLAAPQVHRSIRVSVIEFEEALHIFVNPVVTTMTKETSNYWEGCLSVPGMRGLVARPNKVKVKYLDRDGKHCELTAENFMATVLQHEFDHLDGKVYVDRLVDSTKLMFDEEFEKYWLPNAEDNDDAVD